MILRIAARPLNNRARSCNLSADYCTPTARRTSGKRLLGVKRNAVQPACMRFNSSRPCCRNSRVSFAWLAPRLQGVYYRGQMGSGAGYEGYKDALKFFQQAISEDQKFRASLFETGRDLRCCVRLAAERDPGSCGYEGETSSYSGRPGCNPTNTLNGLWVSHWPAYRSFHSHGFRHLVVSGRP